MNEFLQQFLVESRELADAATASLLALERAPRDAGHLDAAFRALHTLKGGAGIVEFAAMERAVHAAEDILGAARAGKRLLDPALVGNCLACVDQVIEWLDTIERSGELPPAACEAQADRIVVRLGAALQDVKTKPAEPPADDAWIAQLMSRHPGARAQALAAVRYTPDADCFFQGEDPIARLTALPGLLALDIKGAAEWPPLESLDTFRCNLVLCALTGATLEHARAHLGDQSGQCDFSGIATGGAGAPDALPARAREVLTAQLALLREEAAASIHGLTASAAATAANVLLSCGRRSDSEQVAEIAAAGGGRGMFVELRAALEELLEAKADAALLPVVVDPTGAEPRIETTARTLRVDSERIDALVRLTGELTVARNALAHLVRQATRQGNSMLAALKTQHSTFEHLIGELQRSVLALRVLPLRVVFQRFPRLLREMSESLGKPVQLKFSGENTEADKAIVEMLFEPLLHVVRNAVDHGVEGTAQRAERGKPRAATIEMRAARHGDQVVVEVVDDGGGMDVQRIRQVAAERGVATPEVLDAMAETQVIDLVFAPGFSTAGEITTLSGRGVGMDAARAAVERIGGRVAIQSAAGQGTTVRFTLPFSVAVTTVMSVEAGGQMFGVPLDAVVETIRVPRSTLAAVGTARAVVVREQTIPVFDLAQMLGESANTQKSAEATLVIAALAGNRCALDVDALGERLDIILKPLDGLLAGTPGITGTTLLGDGRVLLVLDIGDLLQ